MCVDKLKQAESMGMSFFGRFWRKKMTQVRASGGMFSRNFILIRPLFLTDATDRLSLWFPLIQITKEVLILDENPIFDGYYW